VIEARLRDVAIELLAGGRAAEAVEYASQAVARNVLDEGNHELLVRCLAAAGDEAGAARQVAVGEDVLRRELGTEPSPALRAAARAGGVTSRPPATARPEVETLLEAGRAAVAAGAVEAGLACLYEAASQAAETAQHGRALVVLGGVLVHGLRGRDGEGSIVLHEAIHAARAAGDRDSLATACRELGFVDVQAGRRMTAARWLEMAAELAETDEARAAVLGVQGMDASDRADYREALRLLRRSSELAARCGDARQEAWSLSILARAHLLRDERSQAADALGRSLELVGQQRWLAFLPWPQSLQAELDLRGGDCDGADELIGRAWTLSCQVGDPCWEGMAARVLGLLCAHRGDGVAATEWLDEAYRRCSAVSDRYQWVRAYVLDAAVTVASTGRGPHDWWRR